MEGEHSPQPTSPVTTARLESAVRPIACQPPSADLSPPPLHTTPIRSRTCALRSGLQFLDSNLQRIPSFGRNMEPSKKSLQEKIP